MMTARPMSGMIRVRKTSSQRFETRRGMAMRTGRTQDVAGDKVPKKLSGAEDYKARMQRIRAGVAGLVALTALTREGRAAGFGKKRDRLEAHVAHCRGCLFTFSSADAQDVARAAGAHRLGKCGGAR
jgi:hypothetical protein